MKVFSKLSVSGKPALLEALLAGIERKMNGDQGWRRNTPLEQRLATRGGDETRRWCFSCTAAREHRAADLWLSGVEAGELHVNNIVPSEKSSLDYDEYNAILGEFCTEFVSPAARGLDVAVHHTRGKVSMADLAGPEVGRLLDTFAGSANQATGAAHPLDRVRWHVFIAAAHRANSRLSPEDVARWLEEQHGWPEQTACDLARDYERARALLRYYDGDERP